MRHLGWLRNSEAVTRLYYSLTLRVTETKCKRLKYMAQPTTIYAASARCFPQQSRTMRRHAPVRQLAPKSRARKACNIIRAAPLGKRSSVRDTLSFIRTNCTEVCGVHGGRRYAGHDLALARPLKSFFFANHKAVASAAASCSSEVLGCSQTVHTQSSLSPQMDLHSYPSHNRRAQSYCRRARHDEMLVQQVLACHVCVYV